MKVCIALLFLLVFAHGVFAAPEDDSLKLGKEYLNSGIYDKAVEMFKKAAIINPANAEAQKGLGIAYFHLGDNEFAINLNVLNKSVEFLSEAVRLSPEPDSLYYLGLALLDLGNKDDSIQVCNSLQRINAEKAKLLSDKIANFKEPERYIYLRNEHNLNEERKDHLEDVARRRRENEIEYYKIQQYLEYEKAREEAAERQRLISGIEGARRAAENGAYYDGRKEHRNIGAINPYTGEFYAPAGRGYVGTRDGTYFAPAGPNGVINTRTGEFVPVH